MRKNLWDSFRPLLVCVLVVVIFRTPALKDYVMIKKRVGDVGFFGASA
jgi:hypothetical protein